MSRITIKNKKSGFTQELDKAEFDKQDESFKRLFNIVPPVPVAPTAEVKATKAAGESAPLPAKTN